MAHSASPTDDFGRPLKPATGVPVGGQPPAGSYDADLLNRHYVAGDGRVNENIGLTAVQDIFHSEHDRLLAQIKQTVQDQLNAGDSGFAGNWLLPGVADSDLQRRNAPRQIQANEWNGERLFQAAKFGTETEYQHMVFEEFARYVAPSIHVAAASTCTSTRRSRRSSPTSSIASATRCWTRTSTSTSSAPTGSR